MIRPAMDHEARAGRFLDALACVRDLLAGGIAGFEVEAVGLAQLLDVLNDEAKLVVTPFRMASNDDEEDPNDS